MCLLYVALFHVAGKNTLRMLARRCCGAPVVKARERYFGMGAWSSLTTYGIAFKAGGSTPGTTSVAISLWPRVRG